ncbi:unnamed protein product [Closterium sp. NIES-53]
MPGSGGTLRYLPPQTPHAESTTHGVAEARESAAAASGRRRTPHAAPLHHRHHWLHRPHRPHYPHHRHRHHPLCRHCPPHHPRHSHPHHRLRPPHPLHCRPPATSVTTATTSPRRTPQAAAGLRRRRLRERSR